MALRRSLGGAGVCEAIPEIPRLVFVTQLKNLADILLFHSKNKVHRTQITYIQSIAC
jgi:hypothetical protein